MKKLAKEVQRCQWHITYEFYNLMKYQERCSAEYSHAHTSKLFDAIQFQIPSDLGYYDQAAASSGLFDFICSTASAAK